MRCAGKAGNPFQTTQGNRLSWVPGKTGPLAGAEGPQTQESGVLSRGNKGLLSLLESRRVFLGAH